MSKYLKEIKAYALKNAIEFGKAEVFKVLPKLFQHGLKKEEVGKIILEAKRIVNEVNKLNKNEREREFKKFKELVKKPVEEIKGLADLPNAVQGKVVLRVAPFPSGALHLGNAKTFLLNSLYAEKYDGKLILVMDDTIGSVKKPLEIKAYEMIKAGLKFLNVNYEKKIVYKSDRLKIYYNYAEKLIKKDCAYVCHCTVEDVRENRAKGKACGCRILPKDVQLLRWKDMFDAKEGHATLRIKTDMYHKNPAFRDRILFKISDRFHVRVKNKYRVWPTLEMSWAIDDHLLGITHIIRGNDLMIETDMEKFIWDIFNWKAPEIIHTGYVKIEGVEIGKSKSRAEVMSGEYFGWDDPRTWSIQSLKRRGIRTEAIRNFVEEIGLNKQDITVPIETLYAINRRLIDKDSNRFSFIINPKKLIVKKGPGWRNVEIPVHPNKSELRKVKLLKKIFISVEDFEKNKGKEIRLLHLYNIKLKKNGEAEVSSIDNKNILKINWVSEIVKTKVLMPTGKWVTGLCDCNIAKLKKNEVVQFERYGFVKYQGKERKNGDWIYEFWFAHK